MFKQVSKPKVHLVAILLFLAGAGLYGQQQPLDIQAEKEASISSFDEGSYRSALSGFRNLQKFDGSDPLYSYYAGRCLVELNEDLDDAIELLYGASRKNAPADAVFYLGRAYHLSYNFADARSCYEAYDRIASKQERKILRLKYLIASCQSAREITSTYNPYEVMNVTFMDMSDSLQYSQVKMKGGELRQKPSAYFHGDEDREALTALMFMPKAPLRGDYLYFAGYKKNAKEGSQIFRVRKGSGKSWGDPQEVSSLNSPGNEILPYFDPIENDLYFASDGRRGIGGFDLYRAHYDEERDQWTEAVNLGFPVNSVADEYLLLPGTDLGMVLFFSTRQGTDSTVTIYRVHLIEPKKNTAQFTEKQLQEIAQLGGVAEEMQAELMAAKSPRQEAKVESGIGQSVTRTSTTASITPSATVAPEIVPLPAYQETLALALAHQAVSDSLKDLAAMARVQVRESDDPNDRWVWQKQIMVWEKRANDEEKVADKLYAQMDQERAKQAERSAVNPPETIEVDREIDGLTVYKYSNPGSGSTEKTGKKPPIVKTNSAPNQINRFEILSIAPYTLSNPIPMDVILPPGTFYRIQLGAFGDELGPGAFGGISPLTGEYLKDRGLIKYYAGKFSRYEDASTALPRIHSLGYEDAFIVAWYNGMQVSTQKAKQLE